MLIIFDLNGVLLYREPRGYKKYHAEDRGFIANRRTYVRPGAREFLLNLCLHHEVAIWSTARYDNVLRMIDAIGIDQKLFLFIWSGEQCFKTDSRDEKNKPLLIKPLSSVWIKFTAYNEFNTILIDDSRLKTNMNPETCMFVPDSFHDPDSGDTSLYPNGEFCTTLEHMAKKQKVINENMEENKDT
tara:strand:+ start:957 stop:1514 length:558 start_codon:yes stop_codon:yes gene_type:complete